MLYASGVDVSNHQGTIDFEALAPHVDFVIAKASQGVGYRDPYYIRNRDECLRLGIPFGAYHWLEPAEMYGAPDEIVEQVRLFKSVLERTSPPDLVCTLDIESTAPGGGRRIGDPSPNDIAFAIDVHEAELVHTPLAYGGEPVLLPAARVRPEIARCRLWKAIYPMANNGDPKAKDRGPGTLDPWTELTMWQWTSRGSLPGIFSAGLDMNDLFVPLADLMVGAPSRRNLMWSLAPPWAPVVGGQSDHYRVVDAGGVAVLQGQGSCTVTEVVPDPNDPAHRWSAALGASTNQVTGLHHTADWSILRVTFLDWHTFEFHTGHTVTTTGPAGPQGPIGPAGPAGAPGPPGPVDLASLRIVRSQ